MAIIVTGTCEKIIWKSKSLFLNKKHEFPSNIGNKVVIVTIIVNSKINP